jgi:serine/threonine protein kinase
MDDDDLGYPEESSAWLSSSDSDSEHDESCTGIAMTPYSRITAHHRQPFSIARKTLFAGHRPPHDPDRELAIHKLLSETLKERKTVIPLLAYEVAPNGRIKLDFPLMQTDLKELYRWKKEEIAKQGGLIIERFLEILEALEWVHGLGIIHRDVNPSNILLSNDLMEPAFLADFGISWMEEYPDDPDEGIIKYSSGVGTGYFLSKCH